jgi:pentatricopeptide repeat protein
MVTGYIRHGYYEEGLKLYCRMQQEGIGLDTFVFPSVLMACAGLLALRQGEEIHGHLITRGFETDVCTASALVDMYAKCGRLDCAW